jgi:hypothetical protein
MEAGEKRGNHSLQISQIFGCGSRAGLGGREFPYPIISPPLRPAGEPHQTPLEKSAFICEICG